MEIDPVPGLMVFDTVKPGTRLHTLGGTGEQLHIYDGNVTLRRPITQNGTAGEDIDGRKVVTITGEVRWQSCDDIQCGLPGRQRFEVQIPAGQITVPDIGPAASKGRARPMNGAKHFERMSERRAT